MVLSDKELQEFITKNKVDAKILYFEKHTMTVDAAVAQLNIPKCKIAKSLLLMSELNEPFLIIIGGDKRVSLQKVEKVLDIKNMRIAKAKEVKEVLGYEVGGVPPICHKNKVLIIVDEGLMKLDSVIGGGGIGHALLEIKPDEIVSINSAAVSQVSE